mmetsp:Transcript_16995/g.38801  ORF Transcript_16995/g.38801 Transcript_16995/m.38801 type:complete len:204 (-) Transcript_16995:198-809(-)
MPWQTDCLRHYYWHLDRCCSPLPSFSSQAFCDAFLQLQRISFFLLIQRQVLLGVRHLQQQSLHLVLQGFFLCCRRALPCLVRQQSRVCLHLQKPLVPSSPWIHRALIRFRKFREPLLSLRKELVLVLQMLPMQTFSRIVAVGPHESLPHSKGSSSFPPRPGPVPRSRISFDCLPSPRYVCVLLRLGRGQFPWRTRQWYLQRLH